MVIKNVLLMCEEPVTALEAVQVISNMQDKKIITERESEILKSVLSAKALNNPINMDNILRANILKQVIINLMKGRDKNEL